MRLDISNKKKAKTGDQVKITMSLPHEMNYADLIVWSKVNGFEFCPHAQDYGSDVYDDKPQIIQPMSIRLHNSRREATLEFTALEDLCFVVRQEVDNGKSKLAKARIKKHGTFAKRVIRLLDFAFGHRGGGAVARQRATGN
jgi:hypothetical protein